MPAEITMPQLSDTMTEGTLVKWHKKEGDRVTEAEEIAEVETDKATMPVEAFDAGTLAHIAAREGEKVQVGELIAVIAAAGEDAREVKKQYAGRKTEKKAPAAVPAGAAAEPQEQPEAGAMEGASSHDVELGRSPLEAGRAQSRRESVQEEPDYSSEALSQRARKYVTDHLGERPGRRDGERVRATPLARRIAEELGVDLQQIEGSGPNGRIVQRDVLEFAEGVRRPAAAKEPAAPAPAAVPPGQTQVIPLTKMRTVIAERLAQSKQQVPHFYESIDIDVTDLARLRQRLNEQLEKEQVRISLADLVARAIATALGLHPALNATFDGREITRYGDVNLGIAVALDEGLIVPVLRGVNRMGLREIRRRGADLIERARRQNLRRDEMSGATFTVTNLGTYGVREFSAIINPPEVAILAIGAAEPRAVVRGGQIVARTMMSVTLSADHRAVDGAAAAEFLGTLKNLLEEPGMMLV